MQLCARCGFTHTVGCMSTLVVGQDFTTGTVIEVDEAQSSNVRRGFGGPAAMASSSGMFRLADLKCAGGVVDVSAASAEA